MGMRGPQHEIDQVGVPLHDLRKRLDHILDPLARPDQPESKQHLLPLHAKLPLEESGFDEFHVRNAVRNDIHLFFGHPVGFRENLGSLAGHDHQSVAAGYQLLHHFPLSRIRIAQDRVKSRYHRHPDLAKQSQQMASRRTSIDAELVLHAECLGVVEIQKVSCYAVGLEILFHDLKAYTWRIGIALGAVIHRPDKAIRSRGDQGNRLAQIMRKSGDPAQPWQIIAQEGDPMQCGRMCQTNYTLPPSPDPARSVTPPMANKRRKRKGEASQLTQIISTVTAVP